MQTLWTFRTRNFSIRLSCEAESCPDLSWADQETLDNLESGTWGNYTFAVHVFGPHGEELGADYLGNSIYADPADFRDHIGARGAWGSYFIDMVRNAIEQARDNLGALSAIRLRAA